MRPAHLLRLVPFLAALAFGATPGPGVLRVQSDSVGNAHIADIAKGVSATDSISLTVPLSIHNPQAETGGAAVPGLYSANIFGTTWTSQNGSWAGDTVTGYTHTAGTADTLWNATLYTKGNLQELLVTASGVSAGSCVVSAAGWTITVSANGTQRQGRIASDTLALRAYANSAFNGTVLIKVRNILAHAPAINIYGSDGHLTTSIQAPLDWSNNQFGSEAGVNTTIGFHNELSGFQAGKFLTEATGATCIGWFACHAQAGGTNNTAVGSGAGSGQGGATFENGLYSNNTDIGANAGSWRQSGTYNTTLGVASAAHTKYATYTTALGAFAGYNSDTANFFTTIGAYAGYNVTGKTLEKALIVDAYGNRSTIAADTANVLVFGRASSTPAAQKIALNATTTMWATRQQKTVASTSRAITSTESGDIVIGAGSLSLSLPTTPGTNQEVRFLGRGVAFTLTTAGSLIYYGSASLAASASIPATANVTVAVWDGTYWNVR